MYNILRRGAVGYSQVNGHTKYSKAVSWYTMNDLMGGVPGTEYLVQQHSSSTTYTLALSETQIRMFHFGQVVIPVCDWVTGRLMSYG